MVSVQQREIIASEARPSVSACVQELLVTCPSCLTLETLYFADEKLLSTRRFRYDGSSIYHDCGSKEPCRLYRVSEL